MSARGTARRWRYAWLLAAFCLAGHAYGDSPITAQNWMSHPNVVAARTVYQAVQSALDAGKLKRTERRFAACEPYADTLRDLYADSNGAVRLYVAEGGSDDSSVRRSYYYDGGILRFVYLEGNAVNGTRIQHRVYFSPTGERVWEIQKRVAGPGYSFPARLPDSDLIRDPQRAFLGASPCPAE